MRQVSFAFALVLAAGCAADGLPIENGGRSTPGGSGGQNQGSGGQNGGSGNQNGGSGGQNGGGGSGDLGQPPDLGGEGASCTTACDCQPGLACVAGACTTLPFGGLYCCDGECPAGSFCQTPSGQFQQCGGSGGGGTGGGQPDLGGGFGGFCQSIPCKSDKRCAQLGCGACDPAAHVCM